MEGLINKADNKNIKQSKSTLNRVLVVYMDNTKKTLKVIFNALDKFRIEYSAIPKTHKSSNVFRNKDLIITVGGDGTFLGAAHYIKDTPVLAVSPDELKHEGFFARANRYNFEAKLKKILARKYKILSLQRLCAKINNHPVEHSLNEIYAGKRKAYLLSKYTIKVGNKSEYQKSSGVLIGTAAGSNAWIKACNGKILPLNSKKFQFIVREPFPGKFLKYKMLKKILKPNEVITLISKMKRGVVVADSVGKEYGFSNGDLLTVSVSKHPLRLATF
ncbi:NAD(+)/NADH kinase [Candidatus Woesearchaeota archaeon]|nr:NAD(+)/NADH kinase [Candidatus Woesearchaeota archaeon]